jgi:hypothetical protein
LGNRIMQNIETAAFGAAAIIAQMLIIATFVA